MPIRREAGRWVFDFDRWIDGRRFRRRKALPAGFTRAQAEAFERAESAALFALAKGTARPRYDVGAAVACYLRERAPQLKNRASLENEIEATRDWWAGRAIEQLPEVCAEYAADQLGALAPATIKNRISYLRAACRWAWKRHGMADADPGARVVVPTVRNERQVHIDRRAMIDLARACGQWETRAMIRVAFYSGMRFAEIVRAEVIGGRFVLRDTKNGEPRIVPVHPKISRVLSYGWAWPEHETMSYWFRKAREAVGRPELHFHDLRHSAASEMLNAGVPLSVVGGVLGHKSSASTKRYAHLATATLADALGRIGRKVPAVPRPKAAA
jgi:integrase